MRRTLFAAAVFAASLAASAPSAALAQPGPAASPSTESPPAATSSAADPANSAHSAASPSPESPSTAAPSTGSPSAAAPATSRAAAVDPRIEAQTKQLASILRCPVCQGLSIEDSPTELSHQMKDVIRSQLVEGKTPEEVKAYFVARYGEWILLQPEPAGINLLIYVLPFLGLAIGAVVIALCVKRWTRAPAQAPPADDASVTAA